MKEQPSPSTPAVPEFKEGFSSPLKCSATKQLEKLKTLDFFRDFSETTLWHLAENCNEITLADDEFLCLEGAVDDKMFFVLSGKLLVSKQNKVIDVAEAGEFLGEISLIDCKPRSASIRAMGETKLLQFHREVFHKFIYSEPDALYAMMAHFCNRTRHHLRVIADDHENLKIFIHDMGNILSVLNIPETYLNLVIQDIGASPEAKLGKEEIRQLKTSLEMVISVKKNMTTMINQSLAFNKPLKSNYMKETMPILPLIEETIDEISHHKSIMGKPLEVEPPGSCRDITFNYLDIKRVLQNLIINAGYASKKSTPIKIVFRDHGDCLQISVIDCGCGIPEDIQALLFKEKFSTKPDGNGLGLLSCKDIIENYHVGRLWFESEMGQGSTFHFTLPYYSSDNK